VNNTHSPVSQIPANLRTTKGRQAPLCTPVNDWRVPIILPNSAGNERVGSGGYPVPLNLRSTHGRQTPLCERQICVADDVGVPLYDGGFFKLEDGSGLLGTENGLGLFALEH
jgi:hypothetical protein